MDKKRYNLLINTLNSKRYFLKLRDNSIFDRVERKYVDVNRKKCGLETVILIYNNEKIEFGMFEIVSIWLRKSVNGLCCSFKDGDRGNTHISNLKWINKEQPYSYDNRYRKRKRLNITEEEVKTIKNIKLSTGRAKNETTIKKLAEKYNVSTYMISSFRRKKDDEKKPKRILKNN